MFTILELLLQEYRLKRIFPTETCASWDSFQLLTWEICLWWFLQLCYPSSTEQLVYETLIHSEFKLLVFIVNAFLNEFYFPQNKARTPDIFLGFPLVHTTRLLLTSSHNPYIFVFHLLHHLIPCWLKDDYLLFRCVLSANIAKNC